MALLDVHRLTKSFGGILALDRLDLQVQAGEILGVIGPNGAGKSTLFNVIAGVFRPDAGTVLLEGKDITGVKPHRVAREGIGRSFQLNTLFANKTSLDNLRVGFHLRARTGLKGFLGVLLATRPQREREEAIEEEALDLLKMVGMEHLRDLPAKALSYGYQKTLALAVAMAFRPRVLLLDEPVTALNPERVASVMGIIRTIRDRGTTVLLVEHNMRAIFTTCDRIVVMNYGEKLAEGTPSAVRDNREVIEAYLGRRRTFP